MDAFFDDLGRAVLDRWKRENFSLEKFPQIARRALDARPPATHVDLSALMRDFLLSDEQPLQTDSNFGEPELVAYAHPRFYVQLLFWMDGTTAIHQHEFSGAFHVMHGSSIHAHYAFENARPVTPHLRVGDLRMRKMELLRAGRTVPIVSGQGTIHSLFHLESPSVTVVVRTQHDPGTGPQFNYLPPHVAADPHFSDKLMLRRKQLLDVLQGVGDPSYARVVQTMVDDLDFERGFSLLHHSMGHLQQAGAWEPVLKAFEAKHGSLATGVGATLAEDVRRSLIKGMRSDVVDPEHRFFLALLMNAPTRADLLSLVAQQYPRRSPTAIVLGWVEALMETSELGVAILDAAFPEALAAAVEPDAQPALFLAAFRHFAEGGGKKIPAPLRRLPAADLKRLRSAFAKSALGILVT